MIGSQSAFIKFIPTSEASVGFESIRLASRIKIHEGSIFRTTISSMCRCGMFEGLAKQTCGMYVMCVAFIRITVLYCMEFIGYTSAAPFTLARRKGLIPVRSV